jgi:hypothetical protein
LFPVLLESGMNAGPGTSLQILETLEGYEKSKCVVRVLIWLVIECILEIRVLIHVVSQRWELIFFESFGGTHIAVPGYPE